MSEIDFLPPSYREKWARRRAQYLRAVVVGLFCLLLASGAVYHGRQRSFQEAEWRRTRDQHQQARSQQARLAEIEQQLQAARRKAELLSYLRHPTRGSQLVAAALGPLPASIRLQSLSVQYEPFDGPPSGLVLPPPNVENPDAASRDPVESDLAQLRAARARQRRTVKLAGSSTNAPELYAWLGALGRQEWFAASELVSLESQPHGKQDSADFQARLIVRELESPPAPAAPTSPEIVRP